MLNINGIFKDIQTNSVIPIVRNILQTDGYLEVTDCEQRFKLYNGKEGDFMFDIKQLPDYLEGKAIKSETLVVENKYPFKYRQLEAETLSFTEELLEALTFCEPVIARDLERYYLNGIYFHNDKNKLTLVSTDGHRLHLWKTKIEYEHPSFLFPRTSIKALKRLLKLGVKKMVLRVNPKEEVVEFVEILTSDFEYLTKITTVNYPEYSRIIPHDSDLNHKLEIFAGAKELKDLTAEVELPLKALTFTPEGNIEHNNKVIEQGCSPTLSFKIGLNSKYLADIIKVIKEPKLELKVEDARSPLKWVKDNKTIVIMPMRV